MWINLNQTQPGSKIDGLTHATNPMLLRLVFKLEPNWDSLHGLVAGFDKNWLNPTHVQP